MKFNNAFLLFLCLAALTSVGAPSAVAKSYKRGVSENRFQYHAQMEVVEPGVTWFYNWGSTLGAYIADQEYLEFTPQIWNGNFNADQIRNYVKAHPDTKYILGFNEPNFKSQANMTPEYAAARWPEVQALSKELNLKIVAPALNYSPDAPYTNPTTWMDEFVRLVGPDAFDFTAIHNYGGLGVMIDLATRFHERYGKPVWVTEFCFWPGEMGDVTVASQLSSMIETVEWLEKTEWIYRYAWFKATEESRANFKLIEGGKGEDPRTLSELGNVYVYMSEFDSEKYHPVNQYIPATEYINRQFAGLGKSNDKLNPLPIEISSFSSGATLDYQFDVPAAGKYNLQLRVTGVGEPTRFDPKVAVMAVNSDGSEGAELSAAMQFGLPGNETEYKSIIFPLELAAGKQTIRLKDVNPYAPSGLRISSVYLGDQAGVESITVDSENIPVDVYNMQGIAIRRGVAPQYALTGLAPGLYIVAGKKTLVK